VTPRAITGVGVVSALGVGREAFFSALRAGTRASQNAHVESFDASQYESPRVAEVRDFDAAQYLGVRGMRTLDRLSKLLVVAARQCLHDTGLKRAGEWVPHAEGDTPWGARVGLVVSNAYGSLEAITELDRVALLEDRRYINPSRFPLTVSNTAAGYASIWEDLRALNVSVSDGNCGALDAVACADMLLGGGRADVLLVGGAEAMSEPLFVAFRRFGADFGPFEADGTSASGCLGEGAALVALETPEVARARAAPVLAEIIGYGTSFAPPSHPGSLLCATPEALTQAIHDALLDADLPKGSVDVVVSGISGMRAFDRAELAAIEAALGDASFVVAPKLALGETLGAGGAMSIVSALAYLHHGASDYRVRGEPRGPLRTALVTSMGYYGNASALVIRCASG
jgi:3-oxoacyl-[acyl-carrier-protein] synthase II